MHGYDRGDEVWLWHPEATYKVRSQASESNMASSTSSIPRPSPSNSLWRLSCILTPFFLRSDCSFPSAAVSSPQVSASVSAIRTFGRNCTLSQYVSRGMLPWTLLGSSGKWLQNQSPGRGGYAQHITAANYHPCWIVLSLERAVDPDVGVNTIRSESHWLTWSEISTPPSSTEEAMLKCPLTKWIFNFHRIKHKHSSFRENDRWSFTW